MRINEDKIMKIINKYDSTVKKTGAFFLEIEENNVCITDSCEGVDLVPLNKDLCLKLSEMFRELGENL